MDIENWKIKIIDTGYKTTRDIYIFRRLQNHKVQVMQPNGTAVTLGVGELAPKPTIELDPEQLQEFANTLAGVGYKADKGHTEGKLEATEKHLQDMRSLLKLK